MSDERENLPSASSVPRIMLCRGSYLAERNLPEITSTDARDGTEQHRAFETGDDSGLNDGQKERQTQAREIEQRMVAGWLADIGGTGYAEFREQRLWITSSGRGKACSAKLDYFAIADRNAIILDLKSGWGGVVPPNDNWQLRTQAIALVETNPAVTQVRVGIVQPRKYFDTYEYTRDSLWKAKCELWSVLDDAERPNAPRTPGEAQCKYCRARPTCPEANAVVETLSNTKLANFRWDLVSPEEKVKWFASCKLAKVVIKEIESRIKADLEADPEAIPGLRLKESQGDRKVIDVNEVYNELDYLRFSGPIVTRWSADELRETFQKSCSLPVGKLSELVRRLTGWKASEVETWLAEHCSDWIKRGEPSKSVEIG